MKRREFLSLIGGAAAWPLAAGAQQAMPVIGFLNSQSHETFVDPLRGFRAGLKEAGYVEGDNLAVEYRWAENQNDRVPSLAADLVRRRVAAIAAMGTLSTQAAKSATTTIPVVFNVGDYPVKSGLVKSVARPGGNLTGVNFLTVELTAKRLEILRELMPAATRIAMLIDRSKVTVTDAAVRDVAEATRGMDLPVRVVSASTSPEITSAFYLLARERCEGLLVGPGAFFNARRVQITQLAARHAIPVIYPQSQYAAVGGLISYGASTSDAWRQVGVYVGRILKGTGPAELPVMQATKIELVINMETARMLGLAIPPSLQARADEVIE
jgi:putative tryptophan/tyrosine transport system substrate-binding protein